MPRALLTYDGITQTLDAWAAQLGLSISAIYLRRGQGLSVAEILAPPIRKKREVWPACTAIGCGNAAQSRTMPLCNRHVREAREKPGPKCPRCKTFPSRAGNKVCLNCLKTLERRRKKPATRGMCKHEGCPLRAQHPNGRCEHHVNEAPRHAARPPPKRRCSKCDRASVTTRGDGLCAQHKDEAERSGTLPDSRRGAHLLGAYRPALPIAHRRGGACSAENCPRKAAAAGLCWRHWREKNKIPNCAHCHTRQASGMKGKARYCERCNSYRREHGKLPPAASLAKKKKIACSVPGCGRKVYGHGLCSGHYQRRRHGKSILTPLRRRRMPPKAKDVLAMAGGEYDPEHDTWEFPEEV